jgi:hypothetical protein
MLKVLDLLNMLQERSIAMIKSSLYLSLSLFLLIASLFTGVGIAQAMDMAAAQAKGYGIAVTTPDGKAPLDEGWNTITPEWFYTSSTDQILYFRASGTTYSFSKFVNQVAVANCISAGRTLYMKVESGYISAGGCLPTGGGGGTAPTVTTTAATSITESSATSGGNVTSQGSAEVTARGVCWSTTANPTTSSSKTTDGTGTGAFTSAITGLTASTAYYARAYATNSAGTAYGTQITFTTSGGGGDPPILYTKNAWPSCVNGSPCNPQYATFARSGGNVTSAGSSTVTARGVCWSTTANPTTRGSKTTDGTGAGEFTSAITGLTASTTYYVRAYATNSAGTAYGQSETITTSRFNKNNDGTLTDLQTGLIWLDPTENSRGCFNQKNWAGALLYPAEEVHSGACDLSDGSTLGQWRLPSKDELQIFAQGYPPRFNETFYFWSSTESADRSDEAWNVGLHNGGGVAVINKGSELYVYSVRSGQ